MSLRTTPAAVINSDTTASPAASWANSGAMWLSGFAAGPPALSPGDPAGLVDRALSRYRAASSARLIESISPDGTVAPDLDSRLLGERAALTGFSRNAPSSAGGAFRTVRTRDGWLGLSLARPDDMALIPALVQAEVAHDPTDHWGAVARWAGTVSSAEAVERTQLLDLPAGIWPPAGSDRADLMVTDGGSRSLPERPLIIDLSSLWAGPLCAHLLGLAGCQVVKVESTRRLDGARFGSVDFYDLLHAGHQSVTLDFTAAGDMERLQELLGRADLVLDSSRPRALRALGIHAEEFVDAGTSWLSITARGRGSTTVGFGDDVAVAAGFAVTAGDTLIPVGDALADPLAGVTAAAAATESFLLDHAQLIDVSMFDVARSAHGPMPEASVHQVGEDWWVEDASGLHQVLRPHRRTPFLPAPAAAAGRDNDRWLR